MQIKTTKQKIARKLFELLACFAFVIISCKQASTSTALTADEKRAVADTVRKVLQNYYDDIRQSGLMAEFKYLDSSDEFFWVPPGFTSALSYDSIAGILKRNAAYTRSMINTWDTLSVTPLTKELATYTGKMSFRVTDMTGNTSTGSLLETGVLIRRKDGWKLLCGQTSSTAP
jgi:hypothetical protein